ncbi:hypothetical protein Tco_0273982 [Tanacetum coccineum]
MVDQPLLIQSTEKAQSDKPRLYEIPYDTSDPANRFCPNGEETVTLEKESRSKLDKDTVKPYNYTYQNSLYETFKPPSKAYLIRVIHSTSVSRPQLKSYQVKEKVVPNISQVKFTKKEVEDHHRIFSISKKTKSVTACNDSSNSRTSNANAVCAECGTCVFNSNHDACVSRYLKDVNARTKKPHVVPISASKPKRKANKSVATPHVSLNFIESIKEARSCVQDLTSGEIVSLNLLSRTRKLGHSTMELRPRSSMFKMGRTQSLVAKKKDISENRASRNFDLMIIRWRLLKITLQAPFLNVQKTFDHSRSSLGLHGDDFV